MTPGVLLLTLCAADVSPSAAQQIQHSGPWHQAPAGSVEESYLRGLQLAGVVPLYPWSLRGFSATDLERLEIDVAHPWRTRYPSGSLPDRGGLQILPFRFDGTINSLFPQGDDDGAGWAGRGFSVTGNLGVEYVSEHLEVRLAPTAVWAQNAPFGIRDNGYEENGAYSDGYYGNSIDLPQRFGNDAVSRLDLGQSILRVAGAGIELGVSSANQVWGPAEFYPLLLSADGPGFVHGFLGTSAPVRTPIGSLDARVQWGRLLRSDYSPVESLDDQRLMAGWIVVYTPAGLTGLEMGAARFFHQPWPGDSVGYSGLLRPFEALLAENIAESAGDVNQLASVFARWTFPSSGFEVYGEYGRDDYSYRFRDFLLEPEHTSAFVLGAAKSWGGSEVLWTARAELLNAARPQIVRIRFAGPFSVHHLFREGHTHLGQPLGSAPAVGGGAARLALDRYDGDGRWQAELAREVRGTVVTSEWTGDTYPVPLDVLYTFGGGRDFFVGPLEIGVRFRAGYNVDRNLETDAVNSSLGFAATYRPR